MSSPAQNLNAQQRAKFIQDQIKKGPMTTAGPVRPVNKAAPVPAGVPSNARLGSTMLTPYASKYSALTGMEKVKAFPGSAAGKGPIASAAPAGSTAGLGSFFGGPNRNSMGGGKPMPVRTSQQEFSFITPGPGAIRELPYTEIMRQGREAGMAGYKKGGQVKAKKVSSASKRADGCAARGKTRGRMV